MLVPLNRPAVLSGQLGNGVKIINLTVQFLSFCFGCIGWLLNRFSKRKLATEVRRELHFLFDDHAARIVRSTPSRHVISITVEFGNVLLQVSRHHRETAFSLASIFAPDQWEPFQLIVSGITRWGSTAASFTADLPAFAPILKQSIPFLQEALSEENWHATWRKAIEAENLGVNETAARARINGVEPIFYVPSTRES